MLAHLATCQSIAASQFVSRRIFCPTTAHSFSIYCVFYSFQPIHWASEECRPFCILQSHRQRVVVRVFSLMVDWPPRLFRRLSIELISFLLLLLWKRHIHITYPASLLPTAHLLWNSACNCPFCSTFPLPSWWSHSCHPLSPFLTLFIPVSPSPFPSLVGSASASSDNGNKLGCQRTTIASTSDQTDSQADTKRALSVFGNGGMPLVAPRFSPFSLSSSDHWNWRSTETRDSEWLLLGSCYFPLCHFPSLVFGSGHAPSSPSVPCRAPKVWLAAKCSYYSPLSHRLQQLTIARAGDQIAEWRLCRLPFLLFNFTHLFAVSVFVEQSQLSVESVCQLLSVKVQCFL